MSRPEELKYTRTHEWLKMDGEVALVGITDFAVEQLSDLVFIDLPKVGDTLVKDARFGEVESTKTVSDLIAPVSGTVTEVNGILTEHPEILNQSPFEKGWLIKVRMSKPEEVALLLSSADYQAQLDAEEE
jgi:glycine cleavage system H protein